MRSFLLDTLQVDSDAFDALIECISEGDFDTCEQVPAGDEDGFLVNPLGGLATSMAGPARYSCVFGTMHPLCRIRPSVNAETPYL